MASCVCEGHSWGVLGEAQLQLGAAGCGVEFGSGFRSSASTRSLKGKAFPADSDGCLAQSVYHGGGNNYPQATVWPSPYIGRAVTALSPPLRCLWRGDAPACCAPGGLGVCCQPVQGHQCFPDSEIQPQGLEHLESLGERGYRGGDEG